MKGKRKEEGKRRKVHDGEGRQVEIQEKEMIQHNIDIDIITQQIKCEKYNFVVPPICSEFSNFSDFLDLGVYKIPFQLQDR